MAFDDIWSAHHLSDEAKAEITELPWIKDGIEVFGEKRPVEALAGLAIYDKDLFSEVIKQPWVVEGRHKQALPTLDALKYSPVVRSRFLEHLTVADGISDDEATRLAVLGLFPGQVRYFPQELVEEELYDEYFVEKLFDPERVTIEHLTIDLPLGDVTVTVVTDIRKSWLGGPMQLIEDSVRFIAEFMSTPFTGERILYSILDDDPNRFHGGRGNVFIAGGGMGGPRLALDPSNVLYGDIALVAHETAHIYWNGLHGDDGLISRGWIDEGIATFMEFAIGAYTIRPMRAPCGGAQNIAEMERLTDAGNYQGSCNYDFGSNLFYDLYRNLDKTAFRLGFRNLHLMTHRINPINGCEG